MSLIKTILTILKLLVEWGELMAPSIIITLIIGSIITIYINNENKRMYLKRKKMRKKIINNSVINRAS